MTVRPLDAKDILRLWDVAAALHPIDRTLTMLRAGSPAESYEQLAALPLGERERRAAALRITTFGAVAEGTESCPGCGLAHEVDPPFAALLEAPPVPSEPVELRSGEYELIVRVPDSRDQAEIIQHADEEDARSRLLERCVVAASRSGTPVAVTDLPADAVADVAAMLVARDENAETLITLTCSGCERAWTAVFDAGEFLWGEVVQHARRLLHEIDVLARTYHWSEAAVLAMSAQRRQAYLDMVGA